MDCNNLNKVSEKIISCAIEVHKNLGPGLMESLYEKALCYEFTANNIQFESQVVFPVRYKGTVLGNYRMDMIIEGKVIIELKATKYHDSFFEAQIISYLKITGKKLGLLINFNAPLLHEGIKRFVL